MRRTARHVLSMCDLKKEEALLVIIIGDEVKSRIFAE